MATDNRRFFLSSGFSPNFKWKKEKSLASVIMICFPEIGGGDEKNGSPIIKKWPEMR